VPLPCAGGDDGIALDVGKSSSESWSNRSCRATLLASPSAEVDVPLVAGGASGSSTSSFAGELLGDDVSAIGRPISNVSTWGVVVTVALRAVRLNAKVLN
jgi:hypothetical protein